MMDARCVQLLADYVAAEDALRAFTDRNFGRMCAMCARWTLKAAQLNGIVDQADEAAERRRRGPGGKVTWRVQSWVTNCCNANHALESMSKDSLAGIVASREAGQQWWLQVKRATAAPCAALTESGCYLRRGRPELCNRYFCEAVRDYLWMVGGDRFGASLAARLDDLQRRWAALYATYQEALRTVTSGSPGQGGEANRSVEPGEVRARAGWPEFLRLLEEFDVEIAACPRRVTAADMCDRLFKVTGERSLYEPFFEREIAAIDGTIRSGEGMT